MAAKLESIYAPGNAARAENKKAAKVPPLTLELSYIEDPDHPDVFRIGKGQF